MLTENLTDTDKKTRKLNISKGSTVEINYIYHHKYLEMQYTVD